MSQLESKPRYLTNHLRFLEAFTSGYSVEYRILIGSLHRLKNKYQKHICTLKMVYKRVYELKQNGLVQSERLPVFPCRARLSLTERGRSLVKLIEFGKMMLKIMQTSKTYIEIDSEPSNEELEKKAKQRTMSEFFKSKG